MARPRLLASYFTVAGDVAPMTGDTISPHSLQARAEAAAKAGFAGIGLITDDIGHLMRQHGAGGIRSIVADAGLDHIEFEVLLDWFADGERRANSDRDRAFLLDAAEQLGAYQIKVGGDITGTQWPIERMVESFAELARQAGEAGTMVSLEVYPESNVRDLETALAIAEGCDPRHGGLLLDIWHMTRGGIPFDDVARVPARYIKHVELDDAMLEVRGSIMEDTLDNRKLPGEGEFDVPGFLRAIAATGYDGLYGVEILSAEHRKLPIKEAARRAHDATMRQFALLAEAA